MTMYCSACGTKNQDDANYCRKCGRRTKVVPGQEERDLPQQEFSPGIPVGKLVVLCITTFGLYEIYWHYKNWKEIGRIKNLKITPWARAIFGIFYAFPLFKEIFALSANAGEKGKHSHNWLAGLYFVFSLLYKMPDPWWWLYFLSVFPLITVQKSFNYYWETIEPNKKLRTNYNVREAATAIIGGVILFGVIFGTFLLGQF